MMSCRWLRRAPPKLFRFVGNRSLSLCSQDKQKRSTFPRKMPQCLGGLPEPRTSWSDCMRRTADRTNPAPKLGGRQAAKVLLEGNHRLHEMLIALWRLGGCFEAIGPTNLHRLASGPGARFLTTNSLYHFGRSRRTRSRMPCRLHKSVPALGRDNRRRLRNRMLPT